MAQSLNMPARRILAGTAVQRLPRRSLKVQSVPKPKCPDTIENISVAAPVWLVELRRHIQITRKHDLFPKPGIAQRRQVGELPVDSRDSVTVVDQPIHAYQRQPFVGGRHRDGAGIGPVRLDGPRPMR